MINRRVGPIRSEGRKAKQSKEWIGSKRHRHRCSSSSERMMYSARELTSTFR
jgi:hypothetical protein